LDAASTPALPEVEPLTAEAPPNDSPNTGKLLGFCEAFEQGDGFVHLQGWIAWADKSPVTGRVHVRVNELPPIGVALAYRGDLAQAGIAAGCAEFKAVFRTPTTLTYPYEISMSVEGDAEEPIPLLANAVRPFIPIGGFYRVTNRYVSGWLFDCKNWITGDTAYLVVDGAFVIPVDLAAELSSRLITIGGEFAHSTGGYINQHFKISLDEILQRIWEQDFDAAITVEGAHDISLISSGYELARDTISFSPKRNPYPRPAAPAVQPAPPGPPPQTENPNSSRDAEYALVAAEFDAKFYLENSPDLQGAKIDLLTHFMQHGWREHRDPSPHFSTAYYLRRNTDVREGGINPFVHYLQYGRREGRSGLPYNVRLAREGFQPFVTVIVPNYNHAQFLSQRLDSILDQTYKNFEIVLLDDSSTDGSLEIIQRYAAEYPHLIRVLLNDRNSGRVFSQWRKGIDSANGDLIWICESDDFCEPDFLAKCISPFIDGSVMLSFGRVQFADKEGQSFPGLDHYREQAEPNVWSRSFVRPASAWFRGSFAVSNLIPNVGGCVFRAQQLSEQIWNELLSYRIVGDWYLYAQLAKGGQIAYVWDAVAYFRQHENNTSGIGARRENYYIEHEKLVTSLRILWGTPDDVAVRCYQNVYREFVRAAGRRYIGPLSRIYSNDRVMQTERTSKHILIAFLGFQLGGGELFPIHLANQLLQQGYVVSALILDTEHENREVRNKLDRRIPVYTCDHVDELGVNEFLKNAGVDLIHSHNAGIEYFFFNANRLDYPIPYFVTLHGSYEVTTFADDLMARILKGVTHWVYLTERNIAHLQHIPARERNASIIANAMPRDDRQSLISRAELGIGETDLVFTIASRGIREKGWREAAEAILSAAQQTQVPLHLLLCGSGPEAGLLAEKYSDEKRVHILGYQDRIDGIYRMSDVVVLPTRFQGESFPLSLIQALQNGLPIIATDVGEIRRMLVRGRRSAGILLPSQEDDHLFAASIEDAILKMTNAKTRARFAHNATVCGQEYDIAHAGGRYEALFLKAWAEIEPYLLEEAA
jgi:glycosyltransferase involved in cell wall biosynthesis